MASEEHPPSSSHDAETTPVASRPSSAEHLTASIKVEHPTRVGPYKILHLLGQGGMGLVYLAQREDSSFAQRVALKVIRKGMDSEEIVQRFEMERRLLSGLNHPNIARLIDGGTTEDGRPYFALEYVEGQPIDKYCDANRLSTRDRLMLFRKVCAAVHHAHQNLIVHRDLKPGNVLVTASGEPKLLDFGIAKLLNPSLFQAQAVTGPAVRLMTPEYASPEQARGDTITTATDIYSLGVMLYELLTGRRPYRFKTRLQHEIARIICEEEPERPSTVISRAQEEPIGGGETRRVDPTTVAGVREGSLQSLRRRLRGDIDDIVLKALEKTPTRRYASAEQLSEDIQRHLAGEPVIARPPSVAYRASKFVSRHRVGVAAAASVLLALALGVAGTSVQWARAERAAAAESQQRRAAEAARAETARAYADLWNLSTSFLQEFHASVARLPGSLEARQLLVNTGSEYIEKLALNAGDDAEKQLGLSGAFERLGQIQADVRGGSVGDIEQGLKFQRRALEIRRKIAEADPANRLYRLALASSHQRIGDLLLQSADASAAEESFREALVLLEALDGDEREHLQARIRLAAVLSKLAEIGVLRGDNAGARALIDRANDLRSRIAELDPTPLARRNVSSGRIDSGRLAMEVGEHRRAAEEFARAVEVRRELLKEEPTAARARRDLAVALYERSQALSSISMHAESVASAEESRRLMTDLVDEEAALARDRGPGAIDARNLWTLAGMEVGHGLALQEAGRPVEALSAFESAAARLTRLSDSDTANLEHRRALGSALVGAGEALRAMGRIVEAASRLESAAALFDDLASRLPSDLAVRRNALRAHRLLAEALRDRAHDDSARAADRRTAAERAVASAERALELSLLLTRSGMRLPAEEDRPEALSELLDALRREAEAAPPR